MAENILISYDRMKDQVEKEVFSFMEKRSSLEEIIPPIFAFEKGTTRITFTLPPLTRTLLSEFIVSIKKHIDNIRIHAYEEGYYAFQALNKNLFKTENILENIKVELFSLSASSRVEITKKGNFSQEEVNLVTELFTLAYSGYQEDPAVRLRRLGATVITREKSIDWDYIAGYEDVKRKIKESIILPLKKSDTYDSIAKLTRRVFETNRPRAILFDGAPGVGKTTAAKIISGEVNIPLVYVPIESIMSKWYGQSSQNLSSIFDASEDRGGAILFLDEIDSLGGNRDQNMFEATRRVLSVLLRRLDGIDVASNTMTIGATNRRQDLDNALISRFDQIITFPMPNSSERASIFGNYAQHLSDEDLNILGEKSGDLSGRNIKDICELTERRWARKIILKKLEPSAPPLDYYKQTLRLWNTNE